MGRVIRSSSGPHPFPDVPERSPIRPPQPGEELLKYDLEVVSSVFGMPNTLGMSPSLNRSDWQLVLVCAGVLL